MDPPPFGIALLGGAVAGTTVDMVLFPLDTLKTRLQAPEGFRAAGGLGGVYRGVGPAFVGAAPGAAFFFATYEAVKKALASRSGVGSSTAVDHLLAATAGEVAACAVRVPTEVLKQRAQAGHHGGKASAALAAILARRRYVGIRGVWAELYRGWGITVLRELPFTAVQFPLWEALKARARERRAVSTQEDVGAAESALYGSLAGAVAAALTTPLDVLKTRVMLSAQKESVFSVLRSVLSQHGIRPFFAGIGPRVAWISAGGAIFLGSYQWVVNALL